MAVDLWVYRESMARRSGAVERIDGGTRQLVLDRTKDEIRDAPDADPKELRSARSYDLLTGYYHGLCDTGL